MFRIEFDTNNAAFECGENEIRRILNNTADKVYNGRKEGLVMDINGNQIGYWVYNEEER